MIIDITLSAMENKMDEFRRLDKAIENKFRKKFGFVASSWQWPVKRQAKIQYRESAIRDFLIKSGKESEPLNYIAFWRDGEVVNVYPLTEPSEEFRAKQAQEEKDFKKRFEGMLNKVMTFMRLANNQRNLEPSV